MYDVLLFLGLIVVLALGACVDGQAGYRLATEEDEIQRLIPPQGEHPRVDVLQYSDGRHVEITFAGSTVDTLSVMDDTATSGVSRREATRIAQILERFYGDFGAVTEVKVGIDTWTGIGDVGFWQESSLVLDAKELRALED